MTTELTPEQIEHLVAVGSAFLENHRGCTCHGCLKNRPLILAKLLQIRGVALVEHDVDFGNQTSLSFEPSGTRRRTR